MIESEQVERLKRRLSWEGVGPLAELSNQATDALMARGKALPGWVRDSAKDRPLTSLLMAFQIGLAAGRWGRRRAKR